MPESSDFSFNDYFPDSAKFKGIKTVKNHDDTAFYVCFGVIENFTHQVKLQAVIILPITLSLRDVDTDIYCPLSKSTIMLCFSIEGSICYLFLFR